MRFFGGHGGVRYFPRGTVERWTMSMRWQVSTFGVILFTLPLREPYVNHLPVHRTCFSSQYGKQLIEFAHIVEPTCFQFVKTSLI